MSYPRTIQNMEEQERQSTDDRDACPLLSEDDPGVQNIGLDTSRTETYTRRWWILFVFSFASFIQCFGWGCYGPIAQSTEAVFNMNDGNIGMLNNWANIAYLVFVFPITYFMDTKGIRLSMIVCTLLLVIGTGIRCITSQPEPAFWLMSVASVLIGIGGVPPCAGPSQIASLWFPPEQRATATAFASMLNTAGAAATFVVGPSLVSAPVYHNVANNQSRIISNGNETNFSNKDKVTKEIMLLNYIQAIAAALCFVFVLIYFPDKPPHPPSISASIERIKFKRALKILLRHKSLWHITQGFATVTGVFGVYGTVFEIILNPLGVSQIEAGWIGFYATIAGCLTGLCVARFADVFMRHMKLVLIVMYIVAFVAFLWLSLLCSRILSFSDAELYIACIVGGMTISGTVPLFFELASEASYPVSEGIAGAFLTSFTNLYGILFLLVLLIPKIGTTWMNWCLLGSLAVSFLFLFFFPERYTRTNIDTNRPPTCGD